MSHTLPQAPRAGTDLGLRAETAHDGFAAAVARGLVDRPKVLPSGYAFDLEGCRLFEEVCRSPEHPARAERAILQAHAADMVAGLPPEVEVCELGSGCGDQRALLIDAMIERQRRVRYVATHSSACALDENRRRLSETFPELEVTAVQADPGRALRHLAQRRDRPKLVLWLGANIGKVSRAEAASFLKRLRDACGGDDRVLVGFDLRKDAQGLTRAYDDPAGRRAALHKNLLLRVNRELGGTFDPDAFQFRALVDEDDGRVDMHLVSGHAQRVWVAALGREIPFAAGESIHTETTYQYAPLEIAGLARWAGLRLVRGWTDEERLFASVLFQPWFD